MSTQPPLRRIAAIGDVHARDGRLAVALDVIAGLAVDAVICTGDVADGHGDVNRCCALLRDRDVICVRGNHDRWVFQGVLRDRAGATRLDDLTPASVDFLRGLPPTRELPIPGGWALLCHGIGEHDLEKLGEFHTAYSLRANPFVRELIALARYRLVVNGHSHSRFVRNAGPLTILNAGALSEADPGFTIVDLEGGRWEWHSVTDGGATPVESGGFDAPT